MTNTHSKGPAMATLHFHIASSRASQTGPNAKVPDMVAEGGREKERGKLNEKGSKRKGEGERGSERDGSRGGGMARAG